MCLCLFVYAIEIVFEVAFVDVCLSFVYLYIFLVVCGYLCMNVYEILFLLLLFMSVSACACCEFICFL